jgi:hypothetical protein
MDEGYLGFFFVYFERKGSILWNVPTQWIRIICIAKMTHVEASMD